MFKRLRAESPYGFLFMRPPTFSSASKESVFLPCLMFNANNIKTWEELL